MENFEQMKELVATLNLESTTTAQIMHELMPLLWWKFVWLHVFEGVLIASMVGAFAFFAYKMFKS